MSAGCEPPPCEASGSRPEDISPMSNNTSDSSPTLAKMPVTPILPIPLLSPPPPMSPRPWSSFQQVSPRPPQPSWSRRPPRPPVSRATDLETMDEVAASECAAMCPAAGATSHMETWTTVTHRNPTRPRDAISTAATHTLSGIAPARRKAEFFLSRLDPLTTVEDILSHVKAYLKSNDVQSERLQMRYNSYASFRVTVDNRFYKRKINADMWPEYVVFRRYFPPRNLSALELLWIMVILLIM